MLRRSEKTFVLDYGGREKNVSLDRLKPAMSTHQLRCQLPNLQGKVALLTAQTNQDNILGGYVAARISQNPD